MREKNKKKTQKTLEVENKKPPQSKRKNNEFEESSAIAKVHVDRKPEPNLVDPSNQSTEENGKDSQQYKDKESVINTQRDGQSGKVLVEIK